MRTQRDSRIRFLALAMALLMVFHCALSAIPTSRADPGVKKINSAEALIAYANEYALGHHNPGDTLDLSLKSGDYNLAGFVGIGTEDRPFAGTIQMNANNALLLPRALFQYVATSTTIKFTDPSVDSLYLKRYADSTGPLFADHVVVEKGKEDAVAKWNLVMEIHYKEVDDNGQGTNPDIAPFGGLIGDMADNAKVEVTFTNNTGFAVSANGNVGLICGTMGAGSQLTVTLVGSQPTTSITSVGGAAGGLVGAMESGSKLTLTTGYPGGVTVTAQGKSVNVNANANGNAAMMMNAAPQKAAELPQAEIQQTQSKEATVLPDSLTGEEGLPATEPEQASASPEIAGEGEGAEGGDTLLTDPDAAESQEAAPNAQPEESREAAPDAQPEESREAVPDAQPEESEETTPDAQPRESKETAPDTQSEQNENKDPAPQPGGAREPDAHSETGGSETGEEAPKAEPQQEESQSQSASREEPKAESAAQPAPDTDVVIQDNDTPGGASPEGRGDAPGDEPEGQSGASPEEEPGEESEGQPQDEPGEDSEGQTQDEPGEESEGQTQEEPGEEPEGQTQEEPGEEPEGQPQEEPGEEPEGQTQDEPGEEPEGQTQEEPVEEPEGQPQEEQGEAPEGQPEEQPNETGLDQEGSTPAPGDEAAPALPSKQGLGQIVEGIADAVSSLKGNLLGASAPAVTLHPGHAGGLVGYAENATINLETAVTVGGTISGTQTAGGLVGYAEDTNITLNGTGTVSGAITSNQASGGAVGHAIDSTLNTADGVNLTISSSITASAAGSASGGVFGRYEASGTARTISLQGISTGCTVTASGTGYCGGVIGYLSSSTSVTIDQGLNDSALKSDAFQRNANLGVGLYAGGVVGYYSNTALSNALVIQNTKLKITGNTQTPGTRISGGVLGMISDSPAYVKIVNVNVKGDGDLAIGGNTKNQPFWGGLVGSTGNGGSFLDVDGYVSISYRLAMGGLVGDVPQGVLRLRGDTYPARGDDNAQLIYNLGSALVYALGSGSDYDSGTGWTLNRTGEYVGTGGKTWGSRRGDIMNWGEVVRLDGTNLTESGESGLFTVDMSAHTVTVKAPVTTKMATPTDFALTALNIQLNDTDAGYVATGALQFAAGINNSPTLLASALSLGADIDMRGTGIMGLTRDDGANGAFTGTLNGGGHTLTLNAGDIYGKKDGALAPEEWDQSLSKAAGQIHSHFYIGLFAKTGNATVRDLTLDGTFNIIFFNKDTRHVGAVSANHTAGTLTLSGVNDEVRINLSIQSPANDFAARVGGAVGTVSGGNVTVSGGRYAARIELKVANDNNKIYYGGVVGYVSAGGSTLTFGGAGGTNTVQLGSGASMAGSPAGFVGTAGKNASQYGGLIGAIAANSSVNTVNVNSVAVDDLVVNTKTTGNLGGVLGYSWLDANVTIAGLTLGNAASGATLYPRFTAASGSDAPQMAGLCYQATGYWLVSSLTARQANYTNSASGAGTFGFLVNLATTSNNVLYLELLNTTGTYDLNPGGGAATGVQVSGTFSAFDEIVHDTRKSGKAITDNKSAVLSVQTSDATAESYAVTGNNTYQNQTNYGRTASDAITLHTHSRYYYNLDLIRAKAAGSLTVGEKVLLWSLYNHYGGSDNIKTYFYVNDTVVKNSPLKLTGTADMRGLSYYPVNGKLGDVHSATLIFDNSAFETGEAASSGGADGKVRTSNGETQHMLMQSGLLYDATGVLNVKGTAGNAARGLTLQGNVGLISSGAYDGSGFLVRGTYSNNNKDDSYPTGIVLDGAVVNGGATADYAPLLINKVSGSASKPTKLKLQSVTTQGYTPGQKAATSLIGRVGGASDANITLSFLDLRLDARDSSGSGADAALTAAYGTLTAAYGTTQSIFTKATLLHSFQYGDANSGGTYNFNQDEDWDLSTHNPVHHVTYGREIDGSGEFPMAENQYYDKEIETTVTFGSDTDFDTADWLPYVFSTTGADYHEIKVNYKMVNVDVGCGKYDDPYILSKGAQFVSVSRIMAGESVDPAFKLRLPASLTAPTTACAGGAHYDYSFDGTDWTASDGTTCSKEAVREYLAGAYYQISGSMVDSEDNHTDEITIPATGFSGLGMVSDAAYAFRGVVDGNGKIIVNASAAPLIANSNGAVVKNATIRPEKPYIISQSATAAYAYSGGGAAYAPVIAKVMGGDTFLDNVEVDFSQLSGANAITQDNSAANRLVPVGGYVGVVVSGTVVFRMSSDSAYNGLPASACALVSDAGWLYVNPYVGRVIHGCVFSETRTLDNGTKDCAIPVLTGTGTVTVSGSTVTVSNGEALWALGAALRSGAASASSAGGAYATFTDTFLQGWRAYCACRTGSGYNDSSYTTSTAGTGTPYLVSLYDGERGALRTVGTLSNVTLALSADCDVPDGFRGLGSLYSNDSKLSLDLGTLTGNSHTVTMDLTFRNYEVMNNVSDSIKDKYPTASDAGLGLLIRTPRALTVSGLGLAGSVEYQKWAPGNGNEVNAPWDNDAALAAGMLAGRATQSLTLSDITLGSATKDVSVLGLRGAGGLVGYVNESSARALLITNCVTASGKTVSASAEGCTGGLVGRYKSTGGSITVKGSGTGIVALGTVQKKTEGTGNLDFAGGGLVGYVELGNSSGALTVTGMTVQNGQVNDNLSTSSTGKVRVGGVVGSIYGATVDMDDVTVSNVDLSSSLITGGVIGMVQQRAVLHLAHITVSASGGQSIQASSVAGGVIGHCYIEGLVFTASLSDVAVEGYTIAARNIGGSSGINNNDNTKAAGGVVGGFWRNGTNNATATALDLTNVSVKNCTVSTAMTSEAGSRGAGGLIGAVGYRDSTSNTYQFTGHNILVSGLTMTPGSSTTLSGRGTLVGSNTREIPLKLVGVSAQNATINGSGNPLYRAVGKAGGNTTDEYYGTGGYVVWADYNGISAGDSPNTSASSLYDSTTDYAPVAPYVTVNPASTIGASTQMTGDGFSGMGSYPAAGEGPGYSVPSALANILADGGTTYYRFSQGYQTQFRPYVGKFSTFVNEIYGSAAVAPTGFQDFPLLVLEDTNRENSHKMINSCLNLLANTDRNYASETDICQVSIYRMEYDDNTSAFTPYDDACLYKSDGQFYMTNDKTDNGGTQFSLIDVAFYDPADTTKTKVAYHLYLPVLVKKLLKFNFEIGAASGTTYNEVNYLQEDGKWRDFLPENLGNPATLYFRYTYLRSAEEWQKAINAGDSVMRNYPKTLTMTLEAGGGDLPADTTLVLVDQQTGQAYYSHFGTAVQNGVLSLSKFRSAYSPYVAGAEPTGEPFAPVMFNDFLDLEAEPKTAEEGGRYIQCDPNDPNAAVTAKLSGETATFRLANEANEADKAAPHFSFLVNREDEQDGVVPMAEGYYLTFFTGAQSGEVYHLYRLWSPTRLTDDKYPARQENADQKPVRLLLGNIYQQKTVTVNSVRTPQELIDATKNVLYVTMTATIEISEDTWNKIHSYLGEVYQSFQLYLTRKDENGATRTVITGDPLVTGTYTITRGGEGDPQTGAYTFPDSVNGNYVEFAIPVSLIANQERQVTVTAEAALQYQGQEAIEAQFPHEPGYVTVSADSRIAYTRGSAGRSHQAVRVSDAAESRHYHSAAEQLNATLTLSPVSDGGDNIAQLGINPRDKDMAGKRQMAIKTVGLLDYTEIASRVEEYNKVEYIVQLYQRQDEYKDALTFSDYWNGLTLNGQPSGSLEGSVYTARFDRPENDDGTISVPLDLLVKTGAALEDGNSRYYSNYKVVLTARLLKVNGETEEELARASDYIIYTNAKIFPDFINP